MTAIRITLPERLAKKARAAGLLDPKAIQGLLQDELKRLNRARDLRVLSERISSRSDPLKDEEVSTLVQSEINAHR